MSNESKRCKVQLYRNIQRWNKVLIHLMIAASHSSFVCGAGMMIKGFDEAVKNMNIGEIVDVHLMPEEAYGMPDPANIITVAFEDMPGSENLEIGNQVYLTTPYGQQFPVKVVDKDKETITFDANHEMAGKELNFKIELLSAE